MHSFNVRHFFVDFIHYLYFIIHYVFFRNQKLKPNKVNVNIKHDTSLSSNEIPKIIWVFWFDESLPPLIERCLKKIHKLHPDFEFRLLNKKNIDQFLEIDVESLVLKMPLANLSDLIRLKLLKKYGGVWMDASIILKQHVSDFFIPASNTYDVIGFYNHYQTNGCDIPVIESWFLAAPKESIFIDRWLLYFESIEKLGAAGLYQKFSNHPDFINLCKGLSDPQYLVVYIAAKLAFIDLENQSNYLFYPCDDSAFYVQILSEWKTRKCTVNLYIKDEHLHSPIYKLTSGDRKYFEFLKKYGLINPKSIIGQFLGESYD